VIDLLAASVDELIATGDRLHGGGAAALVSAADRAASGARRSAADQRRTLAGRLALRLLASTRLGQDPLRAAALEIDRTCDRCGAPHGRPRLGGLSASTSTSGDRVLVGVADPAARIGVDVQRVPDRLWDGFDDAVLHPREQRTLSLPDDDVAERIRIWTEKEAVLKSTGTGLRTDPSTLVVREGGGTGSAGWRAVAPIPGPAVGPLWLTGLDHGPDACAAVAAAAPQPLRRWGVVDARLVRR
jgi:4'-phosphopantetheinyl transferase